MSQPPSSPVAALVLAAGGGRRFGATKQLAEVDGRPLVAHAVEAAKQAGLDPVLVVVGHDGERVRAALPGDVEVVDNPAWEDGQATSLRVGIAATKKTGVDALVVLLADQPGVSADAIRAVVDTHRERGLPAVRARYEDRPGHPVLLARSAWPALARLRGDVGARDVLAGLGVVDVDVAGPCPPDVDTPDDLPSGGAG